MGLFLPSGRISRRKNGLRSSLRGREIPQVRSESESLSDEDPGGHKLFDLLQLFSWKGRLRN
jgi:hypothetical protein